MVLNLDKKPHEQKNRLNVHKMLEILLLLQK